MDASSIVNDFNGTAVVAASGDVAVVVENQQSSKTERTNYTGLLPGSPGSLGWEQTGTTLYAPNIKRQRYGRSSVISIANASAKATFVYVVYYDDAGVGRTEGPYWLSFNSRVDISPSKSGSGGCNGSNTICSAKIYSDPAQPLAGVVREKNDAGGSPAAMTHNLFSVGATSIYFPVVKYKRYNQSTGLRVQNVGGAASTITVDIYRQDGGLQCTLSSGSPVQPLAAKTFSLGSTCPGDNFSGNAIATAGGQPLVGMANETSNDARLSKGYSSFAGGSSTVYGPLVYHAYYDAQNGYTWDSSIAVQNLSDQQATVNLYFYNADGSSADSQTNQAMAGCGMRVFSAPQNGFKGSVKITANRNIVAVINVTNTAASGDTEAMYNASNR